MCTYITELTPVQGSAKGAHGWISLSHAMASVDHPWHTSLAHTLNIDFFDEKCSPDARVAVELSAESARSLVRSIERALELASDVV